jgi:hypothetical protein
MKNLQLVAHVKRAESLDTVSEPWIKGSMRVE